MSKRLRFFLGHLFISLAIAICAVLWMFNIWYPRPLDVAVGVTNIFLMMIIIDVILGPTLSFLVYKEGKKTLKMDLIIIVFVQMIALVYGMYNLAEGRPRFLVYNVDRFELVRNNELILDNLEKAKPEYQHVTWLKPRYVATAFAENQQEKSQNMFEEVLAGISIAQRPERYVPLEQATEQIKQRAKNLDGLAQFNSEQDVNKLKQRYPTANAFVPLKASHRDMTVLVNKQSGEIIDIIDLRPW